MPVIPIHDIDDPRVAPYRELRDKELARLGDRFIAEGEHLVRRLLESDYPVESVLSSDRRLPRIAERIPPGVPVYVVDESVLSGIVGYKFHTGTLAVGVRKPSPPLASLFDLPRDPMTLLVCPQILNTHNLGLIIRIAAGLGAAGLVLGPKCCDPWYRKAVRISMGSVFKLPIIRSDDLERDLVALREQHGVQTLATILAPDAEPLATCRRPAAPHPDRVAIVLGPEDTGLDDATVHLCDRRITHPMHYGIDSLNVGVSAAIFLYHFTSIAPR